jgi:hypothetical protein
VFLGVFLVASLLQTVAWFSVTPIDKNSWSAAMLETSRTFYIHPTLDDPSYFAYGYPGTTLHYLGALFMTIGIPRVTAFLMTVILLISLGIALASTLLYRLRPESPWWVGGASALLLSTYYYLSTPASAVILPLIISLVLFTLYAFEKGEALSKRAMLIFGITIGAAFATRFDISAAVAVPSFLFLVFFIREKAVYVAGYALVTLILLDPYLWVEPVEHLAYIFERILFSYTTVNHWNSGGWHTSPYIIGSHSPFAILSFAIILLFALVRPYILPVSRVFLAWMLGVSVLVIGALTLSPVNFRPLWYFFPIFLMWEILFPLFLIALARALENRKPFSRLDSTGRERLIVGFFMLSQVIPFIVLLAPTG